MRVGSNEDGSESVTAGAAAEPTAADVLAVLRDSHARLSAVLTPLDGNQVTLQSYDDDWSLAQVASHLGSSAEIFGFHLSAGMPDAPEPRDNDPHPIWDRWNAKSPADQVRDALAADAAFLARIDQLSMAERERWQLNLFGRDLDLAGLLRMRLSELALHTWDIEVALDHTATLDPSAASIVIDGLGWLIGYVAKPSSDQTITIVTTEPTRQLVLNLSGQGSSLSPLDGTVDADAELRLPAEAFVRLVYGRLDPEHTPAEVEAEGVELDYLRQVFPGV
jgi:uncharacterized protein (TIGR03083 family)